MPLLSVRTAAVLLASQLLLFGAEVAVAQAAANALPRTADGKPDLQGIWQVQNRAEYGLEEHHAGYRMLAGESVVEGGEIPYQPWAAAQRNENFANRQELDTALQCHLPGVPRIMYMNHAFQIFQTPALVAIAFELSNIHRIIYTNGTEHPDGITFRMGDSRGHWEGDTLVVDVANHTDETWLDMSGNFHSDALHVVERYTLTDPDTIRYEATIEDPNVFTRPWTISMPIHRHESLQRLPEYACRAELEEANGDFSRDPHTWYPGP